VGADGPTLGTRLNRQAPLFVLLGLVAAVAGVFVVLALRSKPDIVALTIRNDTSADVALQTCRQGDCHLLGREHWLNPGDKYAARLRGEDWDFTAYLVFNGPTQSVRGCIVPSMATHKAKAVLLRISHDVRRLARRPSPASAPGG
jgi:hypothetical protein